MQIPLFDRPFNTTGIDYVGQLPTTPSAGNKWLFTAVFLTVISRVQFKYQINKQILQLELCLMTYSCNTGIPAESRKVIKVENGLTQYYVS